MLKETGQGNWEIYLDRIGLFFVFTACAGISLIVWIFNWICWLNQCCCCDFLHNPVNKRIAWWMSFSFLLGILACCISAFVSVNRFGFALEGAWCAVDRIYYDSLYGQLKNSEPKWEGFEKVKEISENLHKFYTSISSNVLGEDQCQSDICQYKFEKITNSISSLIDLKSDEDNNSLYNVLDYVLYSKTDFTKVKNEFLDEFDYYARILRACLKVLAMIYYCVCMPV